MKKCYVNSISLPISFKSLNVPRYLRDRKENISVIIGIFKIPNIRYSYSQILKIPKLSLYRLCVRSYRYFLIILNLIFHIHIRRKDVS